jgi:hypothetical protein
MTRASADNVSGETLVRLKDAEEPTGIRRSLSTLEAVPRHLDVAHTASARRSSTMSSVRTCSSNERKGDQQETRKPMLLAARPLSLNFSLPSGRGHRDDRPDSAHPDHRRALARPNVLSPASFGPRPRARRGPHNRGSVGRRRRRHCHRVPELAGPPRPPPAAAASGPGGCCQRAPRPRTW